MDSTSVGNIIARLYHKNSNGLSILHKIKWENVHLTSYSKMRVDLAAQVCDHQMRYLIHFSCVCFRVIFDIQVPSNSVCKTLVLQGDLSTTETQRFVAIFNKFFDLLNVRSLEESVRECNSDKAPYRSPDDERLKVMCSVCKFMCKLDVSIYTCLVA